MEDVLGINCLKSIPQVCYSLIFVNFSFPTQEQLLVMITRYINFDFHTLGCNRNKKKEVNTITRKNIRKKPFSDQRVIFSLGNPFLTLWWFEHKKLFLNYYRSLLNFSARFDSIRLCAHQWAKTNFLNEWAQCNQQFQKQKKSSHRTAVRRN